MLTETEKKLETKSLMWANDFFRCSLNELKIPSDYLSPPFPLSHLSLGQQDPHSRLCSLARSGSYPIT